MLELVAPQRAHLQVALHREHLRHRVGNRRAGGEDHATAFVLRLDVLNLEEHIERALRCRLRKPGNARHLRDVEKVFELVRFVNEEPVDAKLLKGQRVVLFVLGGKTFQFRRQPLLHALQFLHQPCSPLAALLANGLFDFVNLLRDELFPRLHRQRDFLKARMGHNHSIPIPRGDAAEKPRTFRCLEILFARDKDVGCRVKHEQFGRELPQHVIRHDEHRFRREPQPLQLNAGGNHRVSLTRTDDMCEERAVALDDAPNGILLMRAQLDLLTAGRQR